MPLWTGIALAVAAAASAAAGYAGAKAQAGATKAAAETQTQEAQNALDFQKQEFATQQANEAPFLKAGQTAVGDLSSLLAPGGELTQPYPGGQFTAPTAAEAQATPGFQFTLQQGLNALNNSAAAQGNLLSGGQLAAQQQYGQGLASNTYQQSFNNALSTYGTNYNTWQQQQANKFNRLASVAGLGQTTAGQLGQQGQQAASNVGNIDINLGSQLGQDYLNQAAATASGYNAIGNSVSNTGNLLGLYSLMNNPAIFGAAGGTSPSFGTGTGATDPLTGATEAV
jgi:hypothetical protein